jgi:hypothetical protein
MQARMPRGAEARREHLSDVGHDRGMRAGLGLANDEQPVEELQAFADEHTQIHEPLVLDAAPATGLHVRLDHHRSHGRHRIGTESDRQWRRGDSPLRA